MENKKLFESGTDWQNNACLNIGQSQSLAYSLGYMHAANFLSQNASDLNKQDLFIYPIVFLYRHHLELQFKLLIEKGNHLLDKESTYPDRHELHILWPMLKGIIREIWSVQENDSFKLIEHIVNNFQEIDPKSMAFRYAVDLKGNKHLAGLRHINITTFAKTINEASVFLDGVYNEMVIALEHKAEMKDYYS